VVLAQMLMMFYYVSQTMLVYSMIIRTIQIAMQIINSRDYQIIIRDCDAI
jgi:type IV secretory pathway VirB3-like protein